MNKIPLMVDLSNKTVLIIGGGTVAERRAKRIHKKCKSLKIISPDVTAYIKDLVIRSNVSWIKKNCTPSDLSKQDIIIIATNDPVVNQMVLKHAPTHTWVNASHDAGKGHIDFPITLERGKLQIAISTGSSSPLLAKKIKKDLELTYTSNYESYIEFLFHVRNLVKSSSFSKKRKHNILQSVVDQPIFDVEKQAEFLSKLKEQM
ncbi:NAD(P)-binding protein [Gracilibacillus xinjiangensis]|uniref:precorrin-2 dehydrogenase n=1 Tax=Gracilibacillus xinjiangensis TaxID=1193282 RepID=A0ABV8X2T1_9BACI